MASKGASRSVRRSVALPRKLVEDAMALAPAGLLKNLNRLVTVALEEYTNRQRARDFDDAMTRMAADPAIQRECAVIARDLASAEADGLKGD